MQRNQISALVAAMFASAGVLVAGAAHADNFVDRGNPDNALTGQCIDGTNRLCVATKSGTYVATSSTNFTSGANAKAGSSGIAIGDQSNAGSQGGSSSGGGIAIGVGAQALANSATAIGTVALAQGNTALAMGRQSAAIGDYSMALGNVADAHGTSSIALGHSALASGDRSIAIGGANPTTSDGVSNGASYDAATQTRAGGTQSVAIGAGAQTNDNNQVAIGSGSIGANNGGTPVFGGTAAPVGGAVSFGSVGHERQIRNVAAGAADTDAVNVEQLKNVNGTLSTGIANVDARVTSVGNTLSTSIASVDQRVTNVGNSLSTSIVTATQNVVKYTDDSHAAIALDGASGTTISGLAAGVADTDAVNVGQLKGTVAPLQTSLSTAVGNITNLQNNVTGLSASLSTAASNIGGLQAADARNVKYDGASGFDSVTFAGPNGTTLHNVADGVAANDAVNVGQLGKATDTLNQSIANVGNSVTKLGDQVNVNTGNIAALQQDALQWNAGLGTYDASHGGNGPQRIGNLAAGRDGTDAVNVDQLNAAIHDGTSQLDALAVKYDDASKRQVSLGAGNGGVPVRVTNVAEG
ncbi:MAG: adhesin, partial [Burkholderia vietnamiensis]|nr:adhesin [Burkholderia vietnamiensis]